MPGSGRILRCFSTTFLAIFFAERKRLLRRAQVRISETPEEVGGKTWHGSMNPSKEHAERSSFTLSVWSEKYPFHAAILERFRIVARPEVGTMGVTVSGKDVLLLHNPDFVLNTPADELIGVLLHEVHHVLFGHVLADPADYPDEWARTVAEEVTVNEFVKEPLPAGVITLDGFPALPPMESTDKRYARLKWRVSRKPIATPQSTLAATAKDNAGAEQQGGTDAQQQDGADAMQQDGQGAQQQNGPDAKQPGMRGCRRNNQGQWFWKPDPWHGR